MSAVGPWWCSGYWCGFYIRWCGFKSRSYILHTVFYLLLFKILSYKTPIMYFEWRWPSDFGVSFLVTNGAWQISVESSRVFGCQIHFVQRRVKVWWTFFQDARAETIMTSSLVASNRFKDIRNLHFRNKQDPIRSSRVQSCWNKVP